MASTTADIQEGARSSSLVATVNLEVVSPPSTFRIPKRTITLDSHKPVMPLGRSSKVSAKGFTPGQGNGWFDSPVMSRNHATLSVDTARQRVLLTDTGSTHGTHVDHQKLDRDVPKPLSDNDKIRFGVQISRSTETFPPCYVIARIQWSNPLPEPEPAKSLPGKYSLPDESDNDNSSDSGDSEPQDDRPQTQPALPNINVVPPMTMQTDNLPEPKSDIKGPSHNITSIDLTDDAEPECEARLVDVIYVADGNSRVESGSLHGGSRPSSLRSPKPSANPPAVVDLTTPSRAPSIDLDETPDILEVSGPEAASPKGRQYSPVDSLNGSHFLDSTNGEENDWGLADYSDESDGASPSEDSSEGLSEMNDEDAEMFSDDQEDEDEDEDDEIHDDDENDLNMPHGQHFIGHPDWDGSTNSESDSEEDSDEEEDDPLSPPMPADPLPPPQAPLDTKVNMARPQFSGVSRVIDERYPSPSDAAMPKPMACHSSIQNNSTSLGEKTGKAEYFAAREINRKRFSMGEQGLTNGGHEIHLPPLADLDHSRYPNPFGPVPGYPRAPQAMLFPWGDGAARSTSIDNMSSHGTGPDLNDCGHLGLLPNSDVPINTSDDPHSYGRVHSTMNVRRTHVGINELVDHQDSVHLDRHLNSVPGYREAIEAVHKQNNIPPPPTSRAPSFAQLMTSRHGGSVQDVDTHLNTPSAAVVNSEPEAVSHSDNSSLGQRKGVIRDAVAGVKRSIDQISQDSEEKTSAAQNDTAQEASSFEPLNSSVKQSLLRPLQASTETSPINVTSPPTPPATPEDERPTKRRRKVAEAFGIATLGAISASIGIFAALVATAPNLG